MILLLLALALLVLPSRAPVLARLRPPVPKPERAVRPKADDPFATAASWDLLAACLRAGLPVANAVRAVVDGLPPPAAACLRQVGDLLALGADPVTAWAPALANQDTAALAQGARRTARSGAALAALAADLAARVREKIADQAEARAQRASVLVAGPLAACFLPAFLCLGVLPVVIGLANRLATTW
ncbi:type II secretion system F family protein [Umezawaea sp. Da 62-37]|uniref:type II secretion system F family protein n=1 Tax=Umezawaea sp. Da 62-37 TaxID=3075927 RepID=UPI0028F731F8|nr:type II secretion system F family protein [Umezawaea sp. Da 62-37]WNV91721.1 type II secretion system F family protein [Umezawaea sp. Da 62-37]